MNLSAQNKPGPEARRRRLRIALTLVVLALFVWWMLYDVEWEEARAVLAGADPWLLTLFPLGYALLYLARALRWRCFPPLTGVERSTLYWVTAQHNFWNNLLPVRAGELSFPFLLRRLAGVPAGASAGLLLVVRMFDFGVTLLIFVLALSQIGAAGDQLPNVTIIAAGLLSATLLVLWRLPALIRLGFRLLGALLPEGALRARALGTRDVLLDALGEINSLGVFARILGATLLCNLLAYPLYWLVLASLHVPVNGWEVIVGSTFAMFAVMLPVNAPGNAGPQDAGWVWGFLLVGLDKQTCVVSALLLHTTVLITVSLLGGLSHWRLRRLGGRAA